MVSVIFAFLLTKFHQTTEASTVAWKPAVVKCTKHGLLRMLFRPRSWYKVKNIPSWHLLKLVRVKRQKFSKRQHTRLRLLCC